MKKWTMDIQTTGRVAVVADSFEEAIEKGKEKAEAYIKNDNYLGLHDFKVNKNSVEVEDEKD